MRAARGTHARRIDFKIISVIRFRPLRPYTDDLIVYVEITDMLRAPDSP